MKLKNPYIDLRLCFIMIVYLNSSLLFSASHPLTTYPYNPLVPLDVWTQLEPYFLPENHPIKTKLDRLFSKIRATQSQENFEKAGFEKPRIRKPTNIIVGKHPNFKKYILKVYFDTQPPLCEWANWVQRIEGARAIRACLKRHGFRNFCVPKKWIYPLPLDPSPPDEPIFHRKNFILVAEKIDILSSKANLKAFKENIKPQHLEELYTILTEEGLIDSVYPFNIPFTISGKIAFVDTEHRHLGAPVPYGKLTRYLSKEMQDYWQFLTENTP